METKPFSLQSPETIAKDYGGNKQKIAQAMQSGLIDPTAGLLAGMFIDRMRSAQALETASAPTVAQQVMAPPPSPQPAAPPGMPAPGGLGAIAPGGAPAAPPAAPPMPMAEGGLAALPIPDDMFDAGNEYAGGGIVAFNEGGKADKSPTQLEILRAMDPRQLQALIEEGGGLFSPTLVKQVLEEKQPEPPKRSIGPDIDLSPLPGMKPDSREPINLTAPVERLLRDTEKASSGVGAAY